MERARIYPLLSSTDIVYTTELTSSHVLPVLLIILYELYDEQETW